MLALTCNVKSDTSFVSMVDSTSQCLFTHGFVAIVATRVVVPSSTPGRRSSRAYTRSCIGHNPAPLMCRHCVRLPSVVDIFCAPPATNAAGLCFHFASVPLLLASALSIFFSHSRAYRADLLGRRPSL